MTNQLPSAAQAQFDKILSRLLDALETAREHTRARSEFMDYNGSMGGQVLESHPQVEHNYTEFADLYRAMFEQATTEGIELREIETLFERTAHNDPWSHRTRWVEVSKFKAFKERIAPLNADIGVTLRKLGPETAPDWYRVSFDPGPEKPRIIVLHGSKVRVVKAPTPELLAQAARVSQAAREDGLEVIGASWGVRNDDDDEVHSAVRVLRAWPMAT